MSGAQPVQRIDHEIGVAQPAEAVVLVAPGAGGLGDRGGERGDDGPGLLEGAEFERDGGADDRLLPLEGDGEGAHPVVPVVECAFEEGAGGLADASGEALIGAQDRVRNYQPNAWGGVPLTYLWIEE